MRRPDEEAAAGAADIAAALALFDPEPAEPDPLDD